MNNLALSEVFGYKEKRTLNRFLREYREKFGDEKGAQLMWGDVLASLQKIARNAYSERLRKAQAVQESIERIVRESADSSELTTTASAVRRAQTLYTISRSLPADVSWKQWVGEVDVDDFRPQEVTDEASFPDLPEIAENAEFEDAVKLKHREWTIKTGKRGRTFNLSFEAQINDQLGRLQTLSERMGVAAVRTLAREVARQMWANVHSPYDGFQMWCYDHRNVLTTQLDAIDETNAARLQTLCQLLLQQRDYQKDAKSGIADGNLISNNPKYIVCGLDQWAIVWHLVNDPTVPNAAGTLQVTNPMAKYKDMGLQVILNTYLDEAAGGSCDNVYVFADPNEYTPALVMAWLKGTGRAPILAMSRGDWVVSSGLSEVENFDIYLKRTFMVMETAKLNAQIWEGTAAIIPAFQPGEGEKTEPDY